MGRVVKVKIQRTHHATPSKVRYEVFTPEMVGVFYLDKSLFTPMPSVLLATVEGPAREMKLYGGESVYYVTWDAEGVGEAHGADPDEIQEDEIDEGAGDEGEADV